jgi:hypothetical protein
MCVFSLCSRSASEQHHPLALELGGHPGDGDRECRKVGDREGRPETVNPEDGGQE